eukprot:3139720-Pleurochrysis_carterae.AAC.1
MTLLCITFPQHRQHRVEFESNSTVARQQGIETKSAVLVVLLARSLWQRARPLRVKEGLRRQVLDSCGRKQ